MPTRCLSRRPRPAQAPSAQAGRRARPAQACVPRRRSSFEPCVQRVHTAGGRPGSLLENLPLGAGAFYGPASGRLVFSPVPPRGCGEQVKSVWISSPGSWTWGGRPQVV